MNDVTKSGPAANTAEVVEKEGEQSTPEITAANLEKVAKKEVKQITLKITRELDAIECTVRQEATATREAASFTEEKIYQTKMKFLQDILTHKQQEQLNEAMLQIKNQPALQKLSAKDQVKYFVIKLILQDFCEGLHYEQKDLLWRFILSTAQNYKAYLEEGTLLKDRKTSWYKACYSGRPEKVSDFYKSDVDDPFKLADLMRGFKAIEIENISCSQLSKEIEQVREPYVMDSLKLEDNKPHECKILVFAEWKKIIDEAFDHLKGKLNFLYAAVDAVAAQQKICAVTEKGKQICDLVQFAWNNLSSNDMKREQAAENIYSSPQRSRNTMFDHSQAEKTPTPPKLIIPRRLTL